MNKSKFKSVKFKPFDMELFFQDKSKRLCWTNTVLFGNSSYNDVYFTDSCIEAYPELFEVEKAEREFETLAFYKAQFLMNDRIEVIQYRDGGFRRIGSNSLFARNEFQKIGEKIEL